MDDYNIQNLNESKNEWCIRLINILTYHIIEGFKSIFNESWNLCKQNNELDKYLMTFQNMISQIPAWNSHLINNEKNRIINNSNCNYLEDLITCVHIIQLKLLTSIRVSDKSKKIEIKIPSVSDFIHNVYISIARKLYSNIYLFERKIQPLTMQKNNREFELIVQTCILNCVRDNIPVDEILKCYLQEEEQEIEELFPSINENVSNKKDSIETKLKNMLNEKENIEKNTNPNNDINENDINENDNNDNDIKEYNKINDDHDDNDTDNDDNGKDKFIIKEDVINESDNTKSLTFNDTIKAIDTIGDVEEIPMSVIDEKQKEREIDLFYDGDEDDNNTDSLKILNSDNEEINLDIETL